MADALKMADELVAQTAGRLCRPAVFAPTREGDLISAEAYAALMSRWTGTQRLQLGKAHVVRLAVYMLYELAWNDAWRFAQALLTWHSGESEKLRVQWEDVPGTEEYLNIRVEGEQRTKVLEAVAAELKIFQNQCFLSPRETQIPHMQFYIRPQDYPQLQRAVIFYVLIWLYTTQPWPATVKPKARYDGCQQNYLDYLACYVGPVRLVEFLNNPFHVSQGSVSGRLVRCTFYGYSFPHLGSRYNDVQCYLPTFAEDPEVVRKESGLIPLADEMEITIDDSKEEKTPLPEVSVRMAPCMRRIYSRMQANEAIPDKITEAFWETVPHHAKLVAGLPNRERRAAESHKASWVKQQLAKLDNKHKRPGLPCAYLRKAQLCPMMTDLDKVPAFIALKRSNPREAQMMATTCEEENGWPNSLELGRQCATLCGMPRPEIQKIFHPSQLQW